MGTTGPRCVNCMTMFQPGVANRYLRRGPRGLECMDLGSCLTRQATWQQVSAISRLKRFNRSTGGFTVTRRKLTGTCTGVCSNCGKRCMRHLDGRR